MCCASCLWGAEAGARVAVGAGGQGEGSLVGLLVYAAPFASRTLLWRPAAPCVALLSRSRAGVALLASLVVPSAGRWTPSARRQCGSPTRKTTFLRGCLFLADARVTCSARNPRSDRVQRGNGDVQQHQVSGECRPRKAAHIPLLKSSSQSFCPCIRRADAATCACSVAQVWDLGGQTSIRPYWRCYFPNTQAIIYVVDSSDVERISISRQEFHAILEEEELKDAVILVYANKQDLPGALDAAAVSEGLGLSSIKNRQWSIFRASAIKGEGLFEGLEWLSNVLKQKR